jgi:alcohol dehydrogenase (cytochrome c)
MKRFLLVVVALVVLGGVVGGILYLLFPVQISTIGGLTRNYILSLGDLPGSTTTETNPAYKEPAPSVSTAAPSASASTNAGDWPSYNRTVSSDRYSPLGEINTKNAGQLKVLCTYDVGGYEAFESGLIMVNDALIGTTEFDTFSLNPSTCALNWRTHEDYPPALLPANRGAAYWDGMLFRGTQDGRVLAYDFKTGKRIWETRIAEPKNGESVPAAPIANDGVVYIGNAGGDFKGGKGKMYALDAKTGKVLWQFFMVPKVEGDVVRGPLGKSPLDASTWKNGPGIPISGAGLWTSYTLDAKNGLLYLPGGNPAPDFAIGVREGTNLYSDSVVVVDARTGDYKQHFKLVPKDWHDWDVSSAPILIQTMAGKQLMVDAPKDGYLYAFDLANNNQVFKVPVTRIDNIAEAFAQGQEVRFCPGGAGGSEWNGPSYVPQTNLILIGEVEWCELVRPQTLEQMQRVPVGQVWTGVQFLNPFWVFGKFDRRGWAGWVHAVDADTGVWKWRVKSNYPFISGLTPTAGGVAFVADVGGNFYALDAATGQKLFGQDLGGGIGGGVITYTASGSQKVAVAVGLSMIAWPVKPVHAKVVVLGLDNVAASK